MNKLNKLMAGGFTCCLIALPSYAQDDEGDDVFELSPFVVDATQQTGYTATNTLAGTRLNTKVEDLGSALSIYTKELMDDIAATSGNDILVYSTGMEAGGAQGNFAGSDTQFGGGGGRTSPQTSIRTRGLDAPNLSRGLFFTEIGLDSYNTSTVTVNRGANSMLFGIGSPAGVVDNSLNQAGTSNDFGKIELRFGDNDSFRTSIDYNKVVIPEKLAVRIAALHDDEKFDQRPAFERDQRAYAAITYNPTETMSIRANLESGHIDANRPIRVLPKKGYTDQWFDAGMPTFDWTQFDDPAKNPDAATITANSAAETGRDSGLINVNHLFARPALVYGDAQTPGAGPDFGFFGFTRGNGSAVGRYRPDLFHPVVNRDLDFEQIQFYSTNSLVRTNNGNWAGITEDGLRPDGLVDESFSDFEAFDWNNRMIDESSRQLQSFTAKNLAVEQRFFEGNLGIQLEYDQQRYHSDGLNSLFATSNEGGNTIRIDVNEFLPIPDPDNPTEPLRNPNYGRPVVLAGNDLLRFRKNERETLRATAYARYDFAENNDGWLKNLGRHTATLLGEESTIDEVAWRIRNSSTYLPDMDASQTDFSSGSRTPVPVVYLGPSVLDGGSVTLEPIRIDPFLTGSGTDSFTYFRNAGGSTTQGDFNTLPLVVEGYSRDGTTFTQTIDSQAAILQSYWFNDLLITTFSSRNDESEAISATLNRTLGRRSWTVDEMVDALGNFRQGVSVDPEGAAWSPVITNREASTNSFGIVLKWPENLIALPDGTDFSIFYGEGENFTPLSNEVNPYGDQLDSPTGETKDYGFNLSLAEGKFSARVTFFETSSNNSISAINNLALNRARYDLSLQRAMFWVDDLNNRVDLDGNPDPVDRRDQTERLLNALPESYRANYTYSGYFFDDADGLWKAETNRPLTVFDTTDFKAEGEELELVYNPTQNWRILANIARQETIQSNVAPFTNDIVNRLQTVVDQFEAEHVPIGGYPVTGTPIDPANPTGDLYLGPGNPLPINVETYAERWENEVLVPLAQVNANEGNPSIEQREWRLNLVSNYTFNEGKMKGWNFGGAMRWQDELGLGFLTTRDDSGNIVADRSQPVFAPSETNFDAWIGYETKILEDKVDWRIQLNVKNLFGDSDPIGITNQYDGSIATYRIAPEKRWYLTSTFEF